MDTDTDKNANGTLDKFHIGVSADGENCVMVFVDQDQHTIRCVADFAEFSAYIANLNRVAGEMHRRRNGSGTVGQSLEGSFNVAFADFQLNPADSYVEGALISDNGQVVGIRMRPEVACQLTKAMLMSTPAASNC